MIDYEKMDRVHTYFEVLDVENVNIFLGSKRALIIFIEPNNRYKNMILG